MASTSSSSNEITECEENDKPIQIPASQKVNGSESLPKEDGTDQKISKTETKEPTTDENNLNSGVETTGTDSKKEKEAISKSIDADIHSIQNASDRIHNHEDIFKEVKQKFEDLKNANAEYLLKFKRKLKTLEQQLKTLEQQQTSADQGKKSDMKEVENPLEEKKKVIEEKKKVIKELEDANAKDLREFKSVVKTLKQQISARDKKSDQKEVDALLKRLQAITIASAQEKNSYKLLPNLFGDVDFAKTLQFQDFKATFNELPLELKLCLLSFSVFPENMEIKKRVMVYWWIGEGFVPPIKKEDYDKFHPKRESMPEKDYTPEHWANHYFKILLNMGFIESAQKKPNPNVDICTMHPFVRSMVSRIANEEKFFEFDKDGTLKEEFSESLRACLLDGKTLPGEASKDGKTSSGETSKDGKTSSGEASKDGKTSSGEASKDGKTSSGEASKDGKTLLKDDNLLKNVHALMNVDVSVLEFKQDTLSKMRNANVLYLGRWQSLGTHHIEVDDTKILNAKKGSILDGLQNIKNLKFLSLQGISRISELPKSISKLQNLTILDLRACHNLEKLSDDIGCLVNLTHLDMSECYLLDEMPKGISKLINLQVLSGFVVLKSENKKSANKKSCTLDDLKGFQYLRKLSIHTDSDKFPEKVDLRALNQFKRITKLTIAWGRGSANRERTTTKEQKVEEPTTSTSSQVMAVLEKDVEDNNDNNEEKPGLATTELANKAQGSKWKSITKMLQRVKRMGPVSIQNVSIAETKVLQRVKRMGPVSIQNVSVAELPSQLTKLDLQCCPGKTNHWLRPEKLSNLEKLYIRGGNLSDLGHFHNFLNVNAPPVKPKWENVKELRLKYLNELEIDWKELLKMFPKLEYLEKAGCPKLSFFPCNDIGVWTRKQKMS